MKSEEYCLLSDFLYEAVYIPDGIEPPPKWVIESPELQEYIIEFGNRKHDKALVAEIQGKVVGVIWVRIMNDYGNIDDDTPSLAMSVKNIEDWVLELYYWSNYYKQKDWLDIQKYPYLFRKVIMQWRCTRKWDLLLLMKIVRNILWP